MALCTLIECLHKNIFQILTPRRHAHKKAPDMKTILNLMCIIVSHSSLWLVS